jgi:phospholipid/cholesterol/gamma-HCH transport system substrate-binding protein
MINNEQTKIVEIINDLSLTIKNIKDTSIVLQNHLDNIAGNINGILLSVNDNEQGIRSVMAKTNSILSKIDNIEFNELTSKVEECIRKVHESMLVENTNETILELQNTVNSLNKLLIDIRLNPKRYVHFSVF